MDFHKIGQLQGGSDEGTIQRKYFLSERAVEKLEQAAQIARLSLSRTLELMILDATKDMDLPADEAVAPKLVLEEAGEITEDDFDIRSKYTTDNDDFDPMGE